MLFGCGCHRPGAGSFDFVTEAVSLLGKPGRLIKREASPSPGQSETAVLLGSSIEVDARVLRTHVDVSERCLQSAGLIDRVSSGPGEHSCHRASAEFGCVCRLPLNLEAALERLPHAELRHPVEFVEGVLDQQLGAM